MAKVCAVCGKALPPSRELRREVHLKALHVAHGERVGIDHGGDARSTRHIADEGRRATAEGTVGQPLERNVAPAVSALN